MLSSVGHNSSSYRDRTGEFHSVAERLRKSSGATANGESSQARTNNKNLSAASVISLQSEFNKKASRIGLSIHQTTQKLDKLAKCEVSANFFKRIYSPFLPFKSTKFFFQWQKGHQCLMIRL